eukprot:1654814-Prymnesium_polylepis.2
MSVEPTISSAATRVSYPPPIRLDSTARAVAKSFSTSPRRALTAHIGTVTASATIWIAPTTFPAKIASSALVEALVTASTDEISLEHTACSTAPSPVPFPPTLAERSAQAAFVF